MSAGWPALRKQYTAALRAYVATPDEIHLARAYELGRQVVGEEAAILELVALYHRELARLVRAASPTHDADQAIALAQAFFSESLSPVAMAQRGFRDTIGRLRDLQQMLAFQHAISGASQVSEVIERVVTHAARPLDADACVLLRPGVDGHWERIVTAPGEAQTAHVLTTLDEEVIARTSQTYEPVLLDPVRADLGDEPPDWGVHSLLAVALWSDERLLGVLAFQAVAAGVFGPAEVALAQLVAEYAAQALARAELVEEVQQQNFALEAANVALHTAKEGAEAANQVKSEFLSRMSHELRTPLNAILGFTQVLEMRDLGAKGNEAVEHILKAGRHLLQLIDEVLDISRIEAGRLTLSIEAIKVAGSVQEVLDLASPLAATRAIQLVNAIDRPEEWYVLADQQRLKQVLLNLVSNAIKYNRERGQVTLSCEEQEEARLRLLVQDTGPGLRADEMARLFMPFERLGAALTGVEGTGIGLALSKGLVEAMGGTIGVSSVPGQGSVFWIELPRADNQAGRQQRREAAGVTSATAPARALRHTILYIEDNLSNLALIEYLLGEVTSVHLLTAMQGSLGLELAAEHQPDLILLDVHLPDIMGDEVLRRLQAEPRTRAIPVMVLSADATPGHIARMRDAGARAYLTKPLDVKQFLATLEEILYGE